MVALSSTGLQNEPVLEWKQSKKRKLDESNGNNVNTHTVINGDKTCNDKSLDDIVWKKDALTRTWKAALNEYKAYSKSKTIGFVELGPEAKKQASELWYNIGYVSKPKSKPSQDATKAKEHEKGKEDQASKQTEPSYVAASDYDSDNDINHQDLGNVRYVPQSPKLYPQRQDKDNISASNISKNKQKAKLSLNDLTKTTSPSRQQGIYLEDEGHDNDNNNELTKSTVQAALNAQYWAGYQTALLHVQLGLVDTAQHDHYDDQEDQV